jgi:outer membrane protein
MKRILKYSLVIAVIFSATSLFAQKKWTLEECITYALQNNIQIKREVLQSEKYKKDNLSAYMSFTPSLGGQYNHSIQIGRFFSSFSGEFVNNPQEGSGGIGGSLDLFQGLRKWNYLAQSKFDLMASLEGVEELKRNISINVAAKYLEVLYANENFNLAKSRLEISEKQVESSQQQYELGKISNADYLQIKSQTIAEKVQQTNARNTLEMTTLELAQMLELTVVDSFKIVTDNITVPGDTLSQKLNQYYQESLLTMPSIKRANYNLKSADKRYLIAMGATLPTISLDYQISSYYSNQGILTNRAGTVILSKYPDYSYMDQAKDNIRKIISFQVNIPIYGKLQNYVRISKAKIDKLDARYAVEETEKNLLKSIQQSYADVRGSYSTYQSMSESEAAFSEVFETSKEKFNLGMINAVDYGIARNNYIQAQGDLLHAKYLYLLKLKILDFYRGIPITL